MWVGWLVLGGIGAVVQLAMRPRAAQALTRQRRARVPSRTERFKEISMAMFSRKVDVIWNGGLMDGKGEARAGTGAFTLPVTFPARIGEPAGHTSPEELIAAAHAACYAMAFNATLGRNNAKAATTHVTATVTADKGDAGIKIVSSALVVRRDRARGHRRRRARRAGQEGRRRLPGLERAPRQRRHHRETRIAQSA